MTNITLLQTTKPIDTKRLYRYVDDHYRGYRLQEYFVVRETPCGYWIKRWDFYPYREKFVRKDGKNNFAKDTKEAAMENYMHRKRRHVAILSRQLSAAKNRLRLAKHELGETSKDELTVVWDGFIEATP